MKRGYEEPPFYPFSPESLVLSHSSYFWPLGMVAPLRDLATSNWCSVNPVATTRYARFRLASRRLASRRSAPDRSALDSLVRDRSALRRSAPNKRVPPKSASGREA